MLKKLISPFGRLSRGGMWLWGVLFIFLIYLLAAILDYFVFDVDYLSALEGSTDDIIYPNSYFVVIVGWILLWPITALNIKRFHDIGLSGWWYIILSVVVLLPNELQFIRALDENEPKLIDLLFSPWLLFYDTLYSNREIIPNIPVFVVVGINLVIGFSILVMTLIMPGVVGENRYGRDPLDRDVTDSNSDAQERPPWAGQE